MRVETVTSSARYWVLSGAALPVLPWIDVRNEGSTADDANRRLVRNMSRRSLNRRRGWFHKRRDGGNGSGEQRHHREQHQIAVFFRDTHGEETRTDDRGSGPCARAVDGVEVATDLGMVSASRIVSSGRSWRHKRILARRHSTGFICLDSGGVVLQPQFLCISLPRKVGVSLWDLCIQMDIHVITSHDLEQMVRVKRAWWRLYAVELIKLALGGRLLSRSGRDVVAPAEVIAFLGRQEQTKTVSKYR